MSKKDYIKVAEIINKRIELNKEDIEPVNDNSNLTMGHVRNYEVEAITHEIAIMFASDNVNFDYQRFYSACGLE